MTYDMCSLCHSGYYIYVDYMYILYTKQCIHVKNQDEMHWKQNEAATGIGPHGMTKARLGNPVP